MKSSDTKKKRSKHRDYAKRIPLNQKKSYQRRMLCDGYGLGARRKTWT